jgi:transposase
MVYLFHSTENNQGVFLYVFYVVEGHVLRSRLPGNKQSGGKRLSGKTTKGNPYLRAILYEVAWAISHTKDNYLSAFYHRMARRLGKKKAITALAHKVLVIIYHILRTQKPYTDLGADYFDQKNKGRIEHHHVRRLEQLGYTVTLIPKEVA